MLNQRTNDATSELENNEKLSARQRMDVIFDQGTFVEIGAFVGSGDAESADGYGAVITGYGSIDGYLVFAFAQDYSRLHGAMSVEQTAKIANVIQMAAEKGTPLIGVFDSAGAKIDDGIATLDNLGIAISTLTECKLDEPTIAVISGPCGGAAAVFASLFDYKIIAKKSGSLYMTPKNVLENKELIEADELLGNGFVDLVADNDEAACKEAADICRYYSTTFVDNNNDSPEREFSASVLSGDYDMHDVINELVDKGTFKELQSTHAKAMITGLGFIDGILCGIVANNRVKNGGKICPCAAKKASEFINMLNRTCLPVVTLVDSEGVVTADKAELKGLAKNLAGLCEAYSDISINGCSGVTVVIGNAFGTALSAMGSKSLGISMSYALDNARIGVINPMTAVEFLDKVEDESKSKETAKEWADKYSSPLAAAREGFVDDIIETSELRARVAASLLMLQT